MFKVSIYFMSPCDDFYSRKAIPAITIIRYSRVLSFSKCYCGNKSSKNVQWRMKLSASMIHILACLKIRDNRLRSLKSRFCWVRKESCVELILGEFIYWLSLDSFETITKGWHGGCTLGCRIIAWLVQFWFKEHPITLD